MEYEYFKEGFKVGPEEAVWDVNYLVFTDGSAVYVNIHELDSGVQTSTCLQIARAALAEGHCKSATTAERFAVALAAHRNMCPIGSKARSY